MAQPEKQNPETRDQWFATTHWSVILAAADTAAPNAANALENLCLAYWYPLYAYVRRRGHPPHDAQDFTQEFFARLLTRNFLAGVAAEKGKFRSFLLGAMKHFLADERDKAQAQKRGGGKTFVSLDAATGEERYALEPVDSMDPEKLFERRWALAVLETARARLQEEFVESGKSALYQRLKAIETGDSDALPYAQVAAEHGLGESAVKSAVSRMRQRYRELVRAEVANTVGSPFEVDEELRYLIRVISE
jgi:RNA polymerase sigma factor (sigma-70 family)